MPEQRAVQITVASPKGGVGKTMTTILLAGEFAAAGHRVTVLDTDPQLSAVEWSKNSRRAGYADFVLIPTKAHVFDVKQCLGLIRHIRSLGGRHREIPYAVMLNMVSGIEHNTMAFRTAIQLLRQADASVLETFLSQRPTFASIATAGTLYEVQPLNKAVQDARDQTNALTAEIIRKLNGANTP